MNELSSIAKTYDLHIQSHICESVKEIETVHEFFPNTKNYAEVYDSVNLLTDKVIIN